jgi:hypothetical protein
VSRPDKIQCETCGIDVVQQPLGAFRRFCDDCRRVRDGITSKAWRAANPEAHRKHNRDSARRRRRDGRMT